MRYYLSFLLVFLGSALWAQSPSADKIKWEFKSKTVNDSTVELRIIATLAKDWHIFSFNPGGDGSLIAPEFTFEANNNVRLLGKLKENGQIFKEDTGDIMGKINYFKNKVIYTQKAVVKKDTDLKGEIYFQICDDTGCLPPEDLEFKIPLKVPNPNGINANEKKEELELTANTEEETQEENDSLIANSTSEGTQEINSENEDTNSALTSDEEESEEGQVSLWTLFLTGLGAGFVAFITPCIYAMLPITVSFFTKRSTTRAVGIRNAIIYSGSIIGIFALIGVLISLAFSETTMYTISTSIGFNLFVFAIFFIFGISLLGAFEIALPSSWSTKLDSKASTSSVGGIFFMALVLVIVSFSCTSAFISWLIVQIVQAQNRLGGLVGFLGFGSAIALPFAIFAFFPSMLNNIAKSGGWLNSVKVTMGFIELAMAMKFLSNVDLQYHWRLLDYEVYLAIWIVIFGLLGLYLLGKLKFANDDGLPKNMFGQRYLTVTRLFFAIASFSFMVYLVPGMFGAPLTGISGWLPERKTLDFNIHDNLLSIQGGQISVSSSESSQQIRPKKYADILKSELPGVTTFFEYEEALEAAKLTGKPLFIDFTGHSCVNCRKMERAVLSKPEILRDLNENFITVSLYTDDRTQLPEEEQYVNKEGKKIRTLGQRNIDLEVTLFGEVGQPMYIFLDDQGELIKNASGYVPDLERFINIMQEVKEEHTRRKESR